MPPQPLIPSETPTTPLQESSNREIDSSQNPDVSVSLGAVVAGRYRLIANLGEGGSGWVYEAIDLTRGESAKDDAAVAVKVLKQPLDQTAGHFAALQAQFGRWRRLLHPNIIRLIECERDGAVVYMTMEYVAGESLYSMLHAPGSPSRPLDADHSRRIVGSVAQALAYAHQKGVIHGDLKPGNILISPQLEVKVIDFGLTRWLVRPNEIERAAAATPRYASPQIMAGEKPRPSDDVFSLACLAYELLIGTHPFEGSTGPPPRKQGLSAAEHRALLHALDPNAAKRCASIEEFMAEFASGSRQRWKAGWPLWVGAAAAVILGWVYHRERAQPPSAAPVTVPASNPSAAGTGPPPKLEQRGTSIQDCPTCPSMTVLPAGQFRQGAADDDRDALASERPQHLVRIARPLAISTTDVTVDEFRRFAISTGRALQGCEIYDGEWRQRASASWEKPGFAQSGNHPVVCVSWNDATAYADWLSSTTGQRYRLPSASEWEYAARAGGEQSRPWNADAGSACASANVADRSAERRFPGWAVFPCDDGYVYTAPSGSFKANAFGLRDMLGNVFVWTQDCWTSDYTGASEDGSAHLEAGCRERELRGGSWFSAPQTVSASYRNHFPADHRTSSVGLRLVRELP